MPTNCLNAVLAVLAVVALVSQATALKCYQAPKSWDACWTDPSGYHSAGSFNWDTGSFRGDSRFMVITAAVWNTALEKPGLCAWQCFLL